MKYEYFNAKMKSCEMKQKKIYVRKRKWRDFTIVYIEYTMMKANKIF